MEQALGLYRQGFRPSKRLAKPHVMLALNVVGAESEAEARRLYTTQQQTFVRLRRGGPGLVPPPIDDIEAFWSPAEKAMVEQSLACTVLGDEDQLRAGISALVERHRPDELLVTADRASAGTGQGVSARVEREGARRH